MLAPCLPSRIFQKQSHKPSPSHAAAMMMNHYSCAVRGLHLVQQFLFRVEGALWWHRLVDVFDNHPSLQENQQFSACPCTYCRELERAVSQKKKKKQRKKKKKKKQRLFSLWDDNLPGNGTLCLISNTVFTERDIDLSKSNKENYNRDRKLMPLRSQNKTGAGIVFPKHRKQGERRVALLSIYKFTHGLSSSPL